MGKPVHTLSADDGKADASTVFGPKLTNEQIDQLADIFADRQVFALWQVEVLLERNSIMPPHSAVRGSSPFCPS